jgi:AraC family ethanolamine operon transcriptional activator
MKLVIGRTFEKCPRRIVIAEALRGVDGEFTLTSREQAEWRIETIPLGRINIQVGCDGGPNFYNGASDRSSFIMFLPLGDPQLIRFNSKELDEHSLALLAPSSVVTVAARGVNRYAVLSIPMQVLIGSARFDEDDVADFADASAVWIASARCMKEVRRYVSRMIRTDWDIVPDHTIRVAEDELMSVLMHACDCRETGRRSGRRGRPVASRTLVIANVRALVAANGEAVPRLDDLCAAANVSERTLRNVFNECFGIGPNRHLRIQQLHRIRARLRAHERASVTVASIARQFGVWDLGRFASEYRRLFDELPSATLSGRGAN